MKTEWSQVTYVLFFLNDVWLQVISSSQEKNNAAIARENFCLLQERW